MKTRTRGIGRHQAVVGIYLGLMLPISIASAESDDLEELGAPWQQWALSIPTSVNPQLDPTGENCMVGQRGSLCSWPGPLVAVQQHAHALCQKVSPCFFRWSTP